MQIAVALVLGLVGVIGGVSPAAATGSTSCEQTVCAPYDRPGAIVVSCVDIEEVPEVIDSGGGAGLDPGECQEQLLRTPCADLPECVAAMSRRGVPAAGTGALMLVAATLGGGGLLALRRRRRAS